jgi:NADH:ubiquinone oxidoreductase subunit K
MSSFPVFWNEFTSWLPHVQLAHFLIVSAVLFALGLYGIVTRKNAILVLMGVELVLNAANINLIAFSRYSTHRSRPETPELS